jgi:2-polyprenyl-3-methyl-5-hydroxy-6-metoxy-1,4-benzoquinol methylase
MDRGAWLADRRAIVERAYNDEAPTYDEYDPATPLHRRSIERLIGLVPPGGAILDAACGTAPSAGSVIDVGLDYVGADQSNGMLSVAKSKWPGARFEQVGLQELAYDGAFDGVMCLDAMEHVPPEDWPTVVAAFRRALRPGGHLLVTLEEIDQKQIDEAFAKAGAEGSPAVRGEVVEGDTAGYHVYPGRKRVDRWLAEAGFSPIDDADEWLDGYGYRHLLSRAQR